MWQGNLDLSKDLSLNLQGGGQEAESEDENERRLIRSHVVNKISLLETHLRTSKRQSLMRGEGRVEEGEGGGRKRERETPCLEFEGSLLPKLLLSPSLRCIQQGCLPEMVWVGQGFTFQVGGGGSNNEMKLTLGP